MSDNYENTTPAEVISEEKVNDVEVELTDLEGNVDPEIDMTKGEKVKTLLMKPLWSAIVKWVCTFLGIIGLVLYLIANSSRSTGEAFAKALSGLSGAIASFFSLFPIPMFEILICATVLGIVAYLVFIIVRTIQVKGKFHKGGLWVQFGYTLLAVAGIFALLTSMCYGIFTYREKVSTLTDNKYTSGNVTNENFSKTMLYLIDKINNTLYEGRESIFYTSRGLTKYATSGRSTDEITKKVYEAFEAASQDFPELAGNKLNAKELLFTPLYSQFRIASIYSPFTGELCVNTDYPEVIVPMQVAKTMAMQRGFTDDADASFIAYLVCTEYSDDYYINYSGYFNAYLEFSSTFYEANGKNLHLYMANALRDNAKREFVQVVKVLDELYGLSSDLEYVQSKDELSGKEYCDVAKLLYVNFEEAMENGTIVIDDVEPKNYGKFCNYLTNHCYFDEDWRDEVYEVDGQYHFAD